MADKVPFITQTIEGPSKESLGVAKQNSVAEAFSAKNDSSEEIVDKTQKVQVNITLNVIQ